MSTKWSRAFWGADIRVTGIRLAAEIALAPLPVFMWIQSHGWYPWSLRHPAEPPYACAREALICLAVTSAIGLLLGVLCARSIAEKLGTAFMILAVTYLVWTYLDVNAVAYA